MAQRYAPVATLILALGLIACGPDTYFPPNDFERAGTWQAEGVNDRNLRAMVADPSHLTRGVGAATDRGAAGAAAVAMLDACRRPRLPNSQLSEVGGSAGTGDNSVSTTGCGSEGAGGGNDGGGSGGGNRGSTGGGPGGR